MNYNVKDHGDILEKEASDLIRSHFPFYESVWSIYIGNRGNESIAILPNYPDETRRKHFAENSYTVLESVFMIYLILESKILEQSITSFDKYIEFNKAFITSFTLLGRIHDTVIKASDSLNYDNTEFKTSIHKFYEARNIVLHGKKVPLIFDEIGFLKIPFLKTNIIDGIAWDDKHYLWKDVDKMNTEYAADKLTDFFFQLLHLVNNEYAVFHHVIQEELKSISTSLKFDYDQAFLEDFNTNVKLDASGSSSITPIDVYGFKKQRPRR